MRQAFRGYYPPTEAEVRDMWERGLIILDTNALLNLFRYTSDTREDFLKVLQAKREQLWLPHQVGLEFHRRRIDVINAQERAFGELDTTLNSAKNSIQNTVNRFKRHPSLDTAKLAELLERGITELSASVEEARLLHRNTVVGRGENQQTLEAITKLYDGRIGDAFTADELEKLYKRGAERYGQQIPPGYKDKDKSEPSRYGDLVLWEQILQKARASKSPAIFITDDAKEDWWYIVDNATQGPRVELVEEYWNAGEARIHFYSPDRFAEVYSRMPGSKMKATSVAEVEKVSKARPQRHSGRTSAIRDLEGERRYLIDVLSSRRNADRHFPAQQRVQLRDEMNHTEHRIDVLSERLNRLDRTIESFQSRLYSLPEDADLAALVPEHEMMRDERSRLGEELEMLFSRRDAQRAQWVNLSETEMDDGGLREVERRILQLERQIAQARAEIESDDDS